MSIAVIYGSSRKNGNTELLTEHAIKDYDVERIYLRDYFIKQIVDQRHDEAGFDDVYDDYDKVIGQVYKHDVLIFSTPIYWYTMSGLMKTFIDRWSQTLRDVNFPNFREDMAKKQIYVVAVGGDNPKIKGMPLIHQFQYICDFFGMTLKNYVIARASLPGDIKTDDDAFIRVRQLLYNIDE